MESWLGVLEGECAHGLAALVVAAEWPVKRETRERVAAMVALQHLRVPAVRTAIEEMTDHIFRLDVAVRGRERMRAVLHGQLGRESSDEELQESWLAVSSFDEYRMIPSPNEHVRLTANGPACVRRWPLAALATRWS